MMKLTEVTCVIPSTSRNVVRIVTTAISSGTIATADANTNTSSNWFGYNQGTLEQNGKLFVFDASDLYKDSDTFDPTLIIEAYPIVNTYGPFNQLSSADKYVLTQGIAQISVNAGYAADWSGLFAALSMSILPMIIVYAFFQRQIQAGLTAGAVKS